MAINANASTRVTMYKLAYITYNFQWMYVICCNKTAFTVNHNYERVNVSSKKKMVVVIPRNSIVLY